MPPLWGEAKSPYTSENCGEIPAVGKASPPRARVRDTGRRQTAESKRRGVAHNANRCNHNPMQPVSYSGDVHPDTDPALFVCQNPETVLQTGRSAPGGQESHRNRCAGPISGGRLADLSFLRGGSVLARHRTGIPLPGQSTRSWGNPPFFPSQTPPISRIPTSSANRKTGSCLGVLPFAS